MKRLHLFAAMLALGAPSMSGAEFYHKAPSARTARTNVSGPAVEKQNRERARVVYREALIAVQRGRNDRALRLCRRALDLDPDYLQARRMLDRLERRIP